MVSLVTALDHLARGRNEEAADLLAHRLKAVVVATKENSWKRANYLELIPTVPDEIITKDEMQMVRFFPWDDF